MSRTQTAWLAALCAAVFVATAHAAAAQAVKSTAKPAATTAAKTATPSSSLTGCLESDGEHFKLTDLPDGQYQVLLVEPQLSGEPPAARFAVVSPAGEMARTEMDRAALTAAAESTHGKFFMAEDAGRLFDELPAGRRVPIENLPPVPIWNRWWLLSMFLACITAEWILRKRKGML